MQRILGITLAIALLFFITSTFAEHPAERRANQSTGDVQLGALEGKIASLDAKLNRVLENQQTILEQFNILKIRIRRQ